MAFPAVESVMENSESKVKALLDKEEGFNPFTKYFEDKESLMPLKHGETKQGQAMGGSNPAVQLGLSSCNGDGSCSSKDLFSQQSSFGSSMGLATGFQQRQMHLKGVYPVSRLAGSAIPDKQSPGTAQLTIFYNGMVNVYENIPSDKAQAIMLLASGGNKHTKSVPVMIYNQPNRRESDIPIMRKHSLQSFLEKRKDRRITREEKEKAKPNPNPCPMASSSSLPVKQNILKAQKT